MDNTNLQKIRDILPRGSAKKIADMVGTSTEYVRHVLAGRRNNIKILEVAANIALGENKRRNNLNKQIENL